MTPELVDNLKELLRDELLKRGINVALTATSSKDKVTISSSDFQTTPVLYKRLYIKTTGVITKEEVDKGGSSFIRYSLPLRVYARVETFNGGTNGIELFFIKPVWLEGRNEIYLI